MIRQKSVKRLTIRHGALLLAGALAINPLFLARSSYAGAGHDHGSFKESAGGAAGSVKVDSTTFSRLGIKVEPVSQRRLPTGIQATGQLETLPNKRVDVTTPLTSTIKQVLVKPGDQVSEGQALAIVVSPELSQLRVDAFDRGNQAKGDMQQAEADSALAKDSLEQQEQLRTADVAQAEAAVVSNQERVKFAQERSTKDRELVEKGALPRRQMMESEALLAEAKANLVLAKSGVAKAQNRPELIKAQNDRKRAESTLAIAQNKLELSAASYEARLKQLGTGPSANGEVTINAPIAGTIVSLKTSKGESRQDAGTPILSIVDSQAVLATANIYEKDIDKVEIGQRVRLSVESLPKQEFVGRVTTIGAVVSGENRVIPVQAEIDNSNSRLKPGMFAKIQVVTGQSAATAVMVAQSALVEANGKKLVFVQNGEQFEPTDVEVGQTIGDFVEIKKGLFAGDKVVTQRANQLYTQSLSGGDAAAEAAHGDEAGAEGGAGTKAAKGLQLTSWLILVAGSAAVGGAFWGGMLVAGRRKPALETVSLTDYALQHEHPHPRPTQPGEVIPFHIQSKLEDRPVADRQDA